MRTRIILEVDSSIFEKDIISKISLEALKQVKKAKAKLISVYAQEVEIPTGNMEIPKEVRTNKSYKKRNTIIDECIEMIKRGR